MSTTEPTSLASCPSKVSKVRHIAAQSNPAICPSAPQSELFIDLCGTSAEYCDLLPFPEAEDNELAALPVPAKPLLRPSSLPENCFILPDNKVFIDKVLPRSNVEFFQSDRFPLEYFVALHRLVSASGSLYPQTIQTH